MRSLHYQRPQIVCDAEGHRRRQLRAAIRQILKGECVKRRPVRIIWARRFGLSARSTPEQVIARLKAEIRFSNHRTKFESHFFGE